MDKILDNIPPEDLDYVLLAGIELNNADYVFAALEQGADPNANMDDEFLAFSVRDELILQILIDHGMHINILDMHGIGLLERYFENGQMDLIKVLIQNGVNLPEIDDEILQQLYTYFAFDTCTHAFIIHMCDPENLEKFLFFYRDISIDVIEKFKDKLDFNYIYNGENPVTRCIKNLSTCNSVTVKYLLENGSDPNHLYKDKTNILAHNNASFVLEELVNYGIDVNNVDIYGNTPLFYSTTSSFTNELIHKYKVDILHRNNNGEDFLCMVDSIYKEDLVHCLNNGLKFNAAWVNHLRDYKFLEAVDNTEYKELALPIRSILDKYINIKTISDISIIEVIRPTCKYNTVKDIVDDKGIIFVKYYLAKYPSILDNTFKSYSERAIFYKNVNKLGLPDFLIKRAICLSYHNDDLKILFHLNGRVFNALSYVKNGLNIKFSNSYLFNLSLYCLEAEDAKKLFKTESSILKYIDLKGGDFKLLKYFNIEPTDCPICLCPFEDDKVAYSDCCRRASFIHVGCFNDNLTKCIICRKDTDYYTDSSDFTFKL